MNKKILLFVLFSILIQLSTFRLYAVKAYPFPISVTQPDGTKLTILLHGNEFNHYQTTEDGYLLMKNTEGFLTYATLNTSGIKVVSNVVAKNLSSRSVSDLQFLNSINKSAIISSVQKLPMKAKMNVAQQAPRRAYPLNGSPKSLVILVNFSDNSFTTANPQTAFTNLLDQEGYSVNGGTGSAKDYFQACSLGKLSPNFDVVGPFTLPHDMAYYGANDANGYDVRPEYMIVDACTLADPTVDFSQYDTDGDGIIDNVFVYYAGYNEAEGGPANTIWPHEWSLSSSGYSGNLTFDGKVLDAYACTSELQGVTGSSMCGIGTFCHEFGHVLGLPDYYDTSGTQYNTLDSWSIMDYGSYNNNGRTPPLYSSWDRFFLSWLTPQQVSTGSDLTLYPIYQGKNVPTTTQKQSYLFSATSHNLVGSNPNPKEFFMVEYRKLTGWDTYLPKEGMLIWHIDYLQSAWDNDEVNNFTGTTQTAGSHMRVYLQPLSGSLTTPGTAFTSGSFTPTTWTGTNINRPITTITKTADSITFQLMGGGPEISLSGTLNPFSTMVGTTSGVQSINVNGVRLTGDMQINFSENTNFEIKLSSDNTWAKNLTISPVSGNISTSINVRYNPPVAGTHADQLILSSPGATTVVLDLIGTSTPYIDPNAPKTYINKIENTLVFSSTEVNTVKTKVINLKTTDLVGDLSLVLSGTNADLFTVSANAVVKDAANSTSGVNITINYQPKTAGNHTAILTISGGGLTADKVINLNGTGI